MTILTIHKRIKNQLVLTMKSHEQQKQEKIFNKVNSAKSKKNKHDHSYLPPFGIIEKR